MKKSVSQLVREEADRLDEQAHPNTPSPRQSDSTLLTRDPIDAEVSRLFLSYQTSSRSLTPRHRPMLFPRSCAVSYSPQQLLDCIIWPVESDSDEDTSLEEKCHISGFLREYIENASSRCFQELLKFWQGWKVLPKELHVEIVHGQMPQSSTCMETLRLPSRYKSYDVFCEALNAAVSSVQTGFGLV